MRLIFALFAIAILSVSTASAEVSVLGIFNKDGHKLEKMSMKEATSLVLYIRGTNLAEIKGAGFKPSRVGRGEVIARAKLGEVTRIRIPGPIPGPGPRPPIQIIEQRELEILADKVVATTAAPLVLISQQNTEVKVDFVLTVLGREPIPFPTPTPTPIPTPTPTPAPFKDLHALSCSFEPANPTLADAVSVKFEVKNEGNENIVFPSGTAHSKAEKKTGGYLPNLTYNVSTNSIAAGQTKFFYFWWAAYSRQPGEVVDLRLTSDPENFVAESNENNNKVDCPTLVMPGEANSSDLVIESAVIDPPNATFGSNFKINLVVKNQGSTPAYIPYPNSVVTATGGFNAVFTDQYSGGMSFAAGERKTFQIAPTSAGATLGDHTVVLTIDPNNKVNEADETNNTFTLNYSLAPNPNATVDLEAVSCTFEPLPVDIARGLTVKFAVRNNGNTDAVFPFGVAHSKALTKTGASVMNLTSNVATKILKAGEITDMHFWWNAYDLQPGQVIDLRLTSDPTNYFAETNENNNVLDCPTLTVPGGDIFPDLVITNAVVEPANPTSTSPITIKVTVANQGDFNAYFGYPMTIVSGNGGFGAAWTDQYTRGAVIPVGQSKTYTLSSSAAAYTIGNHSITLTVDPGSKVSEIHEDNNQFVINYNIAN